MVKWVKTLWEKFNALNMRHKQTVIIALMASIGVALILIISSIFISQHQFEVYKNEFQGIAIKYPAQWIVDEKTKGVVVSFIAPKENDLDIFQENVNIVIQDIPDTKMDIKGFSETAITSIKSVFRNALVDVESVPMSLAGYPAHKYVYILKAPQMELKLMHVWLIKGLNVYQITYTAFASQFEKYEGDVKRMIRSFRVK